MECIRKDAKIPRKIVNIPRNIAAGFARQVTVLGWYPCLPTVTLFSGW